METIAILASVGLIAGAISGATGFGFSLVATALWGQFFDPQRVTLLALVYMITLNIAYLPVFWRSIQWRQLMPYIAGCIPGVPLGAWALASLPIAATQLVIGSTLLAYGAYMLWRSPGTHTLKLSARGAWLADAGVGFLGGILGGLASLSGFLPALWVARRCPDKLHNRALVQGYILVSGLWALVCVSKVTTPDWAAVQHILIGLPFVAAGGALGLYVFSRLNQTQFMRLVLWMLVVCGALMIWNAR